MSDPDPARAETIDPMSARVIPAFVRAIGERYGQREAVVLDREVLTYRQLDARSAELARGLLARGVGKGTRVGLLLGNGPRWVTWWAAISRIGAVAVPLSTFARAGELRRTIRHADLHCLVLQPGHLRRSLTAELESAFVGLDTSSPTIRLEDAPYLRWAVVTGEDVPRWSRSVRWVRRDAVAEALLATAEAEVHPEDPALTIYTSGTSATPKGVVHTQGTVMRKIHYLRAMLGLRADSDLVANMPFFWVGGLVMSLLTGMEVGARVLCSDASTYRTAVPLGASNAKVTNPFVDARLAPAIGMTETFGMYSWGHDFRVDGYPIASPLDELEPGYDVEVVDESGKPVADRETGEIVVRGPTVTRQLVKVDHGARFTRDGFLRTGDSGRRDGARIHFVGRLDDMIKTSGANVSPEEVEQEMMRLGGIEAAFVVALADPRRGQEVVAAVVPEPDATLDPDDLRARLRRRLSPYKVPRRVAVVDMGDIVRTPSQKVDRRTLAALIDQRTRPTES